MTTSEQWWTNEQFPSSALNFLYYKYFQILFFKINGFQLCSLPWLNCPTNSIDSIGNKPPVYIKDCELSHSLLERWQRLSHVHLLGHFTWRPLLFSLQNSSSVGAALCPGPSWQQCWKVRLHLQGDALPRLHSHPVRPAPPTFCHLGRLLWR